MLPDYMMTGLYRLRELTDNRLVLWKDSGSRNLVTHIRDINFQIAVDDPCYPYLDSYDVIIAGPGMRCRFSCYEPDEYAFIDRLWTSAVANRHSLQEVMEAALDIATRGQATWDDIH